jgi:hypothetical protein
VDAEGEFPYQRLVNYAKASGRSKELDAIMAEFGGITKAQGAYLASHTVLETLLHMNSDARVAQELGLYHRLPHFGEPGDWSGADLVSDSEIRYISVARCKCSTSIAVDVCATTAIVTGTAVKARPSLTLRARFRTRRASTSARLQLHKKKIPTIRLRTSPTGEGARWRAIFEPFAAQRLTALLREDRHPSARAISLLHCAGSSFHDGRRVGANTLLRGASLDFLFFDAGDTLVNPPRPGEVSVFV